MKIIFKFIWKNIQEKKFRTSLILCSVMLSAALFFASSAIGDTMEKMYVDRMKKYFGSAEWMIHAEENSPSRFFYTNKAEQYKKHMEYIVGAVQGSGFYKPTKDETVQLDLQGFHLEELQKMNPFSMEIPITGADFAGRKMILSRITSDKYHLDQGDSIDIEINGYKHRFQIAAVSEPSGPFQEDGRTVTIVMPRETLSRIYGERGKASVIYLKLKNPVERENLIPALEKAYNRYTVREPLSMEEIQRYASRMTTPFMLMTTIVLFMSIFIIYTSFKVITMERLPVIGTFRSIGATKKVTDFVLFIESMAYGIIGGFLGCGLGVGVLYAMTYTMADNPWSGGRMKTSIQFTTGQLITAFLLAVVLSCVSALIPIIKVSKISVKDIVLNKVDTYKKGKSFRLPLGIALLVFALVAPWIVPKTMMMAVGTLCMVSSGVAVTMLVPYMTNGFVKGFEKLYVYLFGNEGILAAKNLRENKSILNNISLLSIGISSLLLINTISDSVMTELMSFYKDADFGVWMWVAEGDRRVDGLIRTVEGVEDTYGVYAANGVDVAGSNSEINLVHGVDTTKHLNYWRNDIGPEDMENLEEGRNIILTYSLKDKFGVEAGDILSLEMEKGKKDYKVIGFFNSLMWNGNYALISAKYLKQDMNKVYYDDIFVKTSKNNDEIKIALQKKFARRSPWVETLTQMELNDKLSNAQLFVILKGFSIMTLVIGIFGVLNNLIISFIERKRSLAVFRSVGMSKKQIIKMIFIEAFTGGLIGGIAGALTGLLMISIVPHVLKAMDSPIPIHYSLKLFSYSMISGIIITVVASISPALKSSRLNIIEAIKYE
ncbi:MAG: hypothetical protein K0R93_2918 [Anaerosolibacter sp.]|uniref:ABC transporter permease n=1 Tax=Anaerosolibacter sp. TaxID=1872527 RepID=UPI00260603E8|nr:FtsX-like permease family protein [Anaerosolibacter sp.]MDF2548020.1 hypothetical protein [Anaerosolibacter sp.]